MILTKVLARPSLSIGLVVATMLLAELAHAASPTIGVNPDLGGTRALVYWSSPDGGQSGEEVLVRCYTVPTPGETTWIARDVPSSAGNLMLDGLRIGARYQAYVVRPGVAGAPLWQTETRVFQTRTTPPTVAAAGFGVGIRSVNTGAFPIITTYVSVSDLAGTPVSDLAAANFSATENGVAQTNLFNVIPPSTGSSTRVADILFVIDDTGSMGPYIAGVRNSVIDFANRLTTSGVDFRLGLVTFKDYVTDYNGRALTSDVNQFIGWVSGLYASGGDDTPEVAFDAMADAARWAIRPGSQRVLIVITDATSHYRGDGTYFSSWTQSEVIALLTDPSVQAQTNVVSFSFPQYTGPGSVTAATGGTFYTLGSDFSGIIGGIGNTIANQYIVQYLSSNPAYDGTDREVRITAARNAASGYAIAHYTPGAAPTVTLTSATATALDVAQVAGAVLPVGVRVVDGVAPFVTAVTLRYRVAGSAGAYASIAMNSAGGDLYQANIPATAVVSPGVSFYVEATDGVASSTLPAIDPNTRPLQFAVLPNVPPAITHTPIAMATRGAPIAIDAQVVDHTHALASVRLEYKSMTQFVYTAVDMTPGVNDHFTATIPAAVVTTAGVQYQIRATDDLGIASQKGPYAVTVPASRVVADLGFLPDPDGFHFENHPSTATWEMFERYFGRSNVRFTNGKKRPSADSYFKKNYKTAGGSGSCAGFSSCTAINFFGEAQPSAGDFAMPSVSRLYDDDREWPNAFLLRFDHSLSDPITYYQAAQVSNNILIEKNRTGKLPFSQAYEELRSDLVDGKPVVVGIHADGLSTEGHALAPYRLVEDGNTATLSVYDCNHPGANSRKGIVIDLAAHSWSYTLWDGKVWSGSESSGSFTFVPVAKYLEAGVRNWTLEADKTVRFSPPSGGSHIAGVTTSSSGVLVMGTGGGGLALQDDAGRGVGRRWSGPTIPDARALRWIDDWRGTSLSDSWEVPNAPMEFVVGAAPADSDTSAITVFTGGRVLGVDAPGGRTLSGRIEPDLSALAVQAAAGPLELSYLTEDEQQARVTRWHVGGASDGVWTVSGGGGSSEVSLQSSLGSSTYDVQLEAIGAGEGEQALSGIWIGPHERHLIRTPDWSSLGSTELEILVDDDGDGEPDRVDATTTCRLDVDPDVLNASSNGRYVTAHVQLRAPWETARLVPGTTALSGLSPAREPAIGDDDGDGIPDITIKFDRADVIRGIGSASTWMPKFVAKATVGPDTLYVSGLDTIQVILPHVIRPGAGEFLDLDAPTVVEWSVPASLNCDHVDVSVTLDGGTTWAPISLGIVGATSVVWHTPTTPSPAAMVAVEAFQGTTSVGKALGPLFRIGTQATGVGESPSVLRAYLAAPRPSPFAGHTTVEFGLPQPAHARVEILDLGGRRVRTLVDDVLPAGVHMIEWRGTADDGRPMAAGMYIVRFEASGASRVQKVLLLR